MRFRESNLYPLMAARSPVAKAAHGVPRIEKARLAASSNSSCSGFVFKMDLEMVSVIENRGF